MDLLVKHVFANAMYKGNENDKKIDLAFQSNGCPHVYNIGNRAVYKSSELCRKGCEACFNQPIEAIQ